MHSLVHTSPCFLNIHLYLKIEDSNFDSSKAMVFDFKEDLNEYVQKQPPEVFCEKSVIKNSANFTGKRLNWSLFLVTLLSFKPATLLKRDSNTSVFL